MASCLAMLPYIAFDLFAAFDEAHWTPLSYAFPVLEVVSAATALAGHLKVGGVINALYVLAGIALFVTGEAPVVAPGVDFFGDKFSMAWAGWKVSFTHHAVRAPDSLRSANDTAKSAALTSGHGYF